MEMQSSEPMRVPVTPEVLEYILSNGMPPGRAQRELIERTDAECHSVAGMRVAPEQGALLTMLALIVGARQAVEVGTFTGYSSLCIAQALSPDGHLLCCDVSEEWTALARDAWERAGVSDRIELRIAPAMETLQALPLEEYIDFSFIDADKTGYWDYFEELLPRTRPGGLLIFDNVLFGGRVLDENAEGQAAFLREFNPRLAADKRVDTVMLPVADGLTIARKLT